jgi:chemotaxis protein CheD
MASPSLSSLGFEHRVVVGIADLAVSNNTSVTLATYSLGSCVAVTLYDAVARVGGMVHVMLPDSSIDPDKARRQPGMFVDTGLPAVFRAAYELGAQKGRLRVTVVGGSQIMDSSGFFNIGKRNCETTLQILGDNGVRVAAEQMGGVVNRTVYLQLSTGQVRLKVSGQATEIVLI